MLDFLDVFKMRNVAAAALAFVLEWGLSTAGGVAFGAGSFALFLVTFILVFWGVERALKRRGASRSAPKTASAAMKRGEGEGLDADRGEAGGDGGGD